MRIIQHIRAGIRPRGTDWNSLLPTTLCGAPVGSMDIYLSDAAPILHGHDQYVCGRCLGEAERIVLERSKRS